jgi:hypothetical protein
MRLTRRIQSLSFAAVLAAGTATLVIPTTARAAAPCDETSLVAAITAVNGAGGGVVTLTPGCTYALTTNHSTGHGPNGLPLITTSMTLEGNANTITRSAGAPAFRIAEVTGTGSLTLKSVTLSNGSAAAGLLGLGTGDGGGIYNGGAVTLTGSTLSGNTAGGRGGGIYNGLGAATFTSSALSGNTAGSGLGLVGGNGGGVFNDGGTVTFTSSTVSGNTAAALVGLLGGGLGGGMYANGGTVTVTSTPVSANHATGNAGGIYRNGGIMTITTSPITGNSANNCVTSSPPVPSCVG